MICKKFKGEMKHNHITPRALNPKQMVILEPGDNRRFSKILRVINIVHNSADNAEMFKFFNNVTTVATDCNYSQLQL